MINMSYGQNILSDYSKVRLRERTLADIILGRKLIMKIDHNNTEEIVCPWCGYSMNGWGVQDDNGETYCYSCNKKFNYHKHIEVSYSTDRNIEDCPHENLEEFDYGKKHFKNCDDCGFIESSVIKEVDNGKDG